MKGSRSVTVTMSRVKARSIVEALMDMQLRSLGQEIEKSLRALGEVRADGIWIQNKRWWKAGEKESRGFKGKHE